LKSSELIKKLKRAGFVLLRQGKGSHEIWHHPGTGKEIVVPNHGSKEVGKGLAQKILKDAGIKN
jgi:predicted RNA binding protein YcfA (HicA-like mRNA interferase family)